MTFATIAASNSSVQATNSTSHTVDLPASISAGNLLIASVVTDARPTMSGDLNDTWTQLTADAPGNDLMRLYLFFRVATGSEGASVGFTLATAQCSAHRTYRITGQHESTNPFAGGNNAADSTTSLNPGAVNPSTWDVEDALWIFFCGNDDGTTTITGFPTSYINTGQIAGGDATDGVNLAWCTRENAVASEDPSAFTLSVAEACVTFGVAIRPSAVTPPVTPTAIDASAAVLQPLVQNTTLEMPVIQMPALLTETPLIILLVFPGTLSASAAMQSPVVSNIGTQQNVDTPIINANATLMTPLGVFLVGPIQPSTLSVPATFFSPFVNVPISPEIIVQSATLQSPNVNLSMQFLLVDVLVSGQFVFAPSIAGGFGIAGIKQTIIEFSRSASLSDPDFAGSVSDAENSVALQESHTVILLDQES